MSSNVPSLVFAIPTYGPIHRRVYESHLAVMGNLARNGIVATPKAAIVTGKMGLASASNEIVRVVRSLKPDYVFWTEQDMVLPHDAVWKLLKHAIQYDFDVLSGVYFLRGSGQPCLFRRNDMPGHSDYAHTPLTTFPKNALFELEGCPGVGCVLFKTSVFDKMDEPWWDDQEGKCGQDIFFYTNLRKKGVKVFIDSSVVCEQIDEDEPRNWTIKDYYNWSAENIQKGFIHSDTHTIPIPEEDHAKVY